ncbi:hypothetical protein GALMADRAFT_215187 [Galerina marginata CBS 339.88]|uniref:Uncharacterized protein n=1 Tax=Galerina marginata (strain CBS 339.88) TaxID=685588 RepID=A0A067SRZ5_GALM3|nr:hypothetical protein GALMADRAFT_215187 [Galerina marginata CBS 339.88]
MPSKIEKMHRNESHKKGRTEKTENELEDRSHLPIRGLIYSYQATTPKKKNKGQEAEKTRREGRTNAEIIRKTENRTEGDEMNNAPRNHPERLLKRKWHHENKKGWMGTGYRGGGSGNWRQRSNLK